MTLLPKVRLKVMPQVPMPPGLTSYPSSSVTPANNGQMAFELTSDTQLTIRVKGSDGIVRSVALALT